MKAVRMIIAAVLSLADTIGGTHAETIVGLASSMDSVMPRRGVEVRPVESVRIRLARHEKEAVQILVKDAAGDLRGVKVSVTDLNRDEEWRPWPSETFAAENIDCDVMGYVWAVYPVSNRYNHATHYNVKTDKKPGYRREFDWECRDDWYPDPILDFLDGVEIRRGDVQSFWVRVNCPDDQPAGIYRGVLKVSWTEGIRKIPLEIRVNDFSVPVYSPLPLAVTYSPMSHATNAAEWAKAEAKARAADPEGPVMLAKGRAAEWGRFLSDYYLTMDSLYTRTNLNWEVLAELRDNGRLGNFNLGYWGYFRGGESEEKEWRATTLPRLKRNYEKAKELGILDKAYVYGCDEVNTNYFDNIRRCVEILKAELPGVPISTTAYDDDFGVDTKLDMMDWFTPLTPKYDIAKAMKARSDGRQVWWYICCGPGSGWANAFTHHPAIDLRMLMGAQSVRMRPDGFLYYQISIWNAARPITKGPYTDWKAMSFMTLNGDGCWTAVGPGGKPLPTQRLENFRDGLEDYAYARLLEAKLAGANPSSAKARRARQLLAVPRSVMDAMTNYTDDAAAVLSWRDEMADLIEEEW